MTSAILANGNTRLLDFNNFLFRAVSFKRLLLLTFHFSLLAVCALAQEAEPYQQPPPDDLVPPPLKVFSKQERTSLDALSADVSERAKLSLDMMEARLKKAEDLYAQEKFDAMFDELGGFGALIDDALAFLKKNDNGRGKILNNYKKLEMTLRKFAPRIEIIRREIPARYEYWVRSLIKDVRAARTKAVEPLFGSTDM